jgi:hypothetical protein
MSQSCLGVCRDAGKGLNTFEIFNVAEFKVGFEGAGRHAYISTDETGKGDKQHLLVLPIQV